MLAAKLTLYQTPREMGRSSSTPNLYGSGYQIRSSPGASPTTSAMASPHMSPSPSFHDIGGANEDLMESGFQKEVADVESILMQGT